MKTIRLFLAIVLLLIGLATPSYAVNGYGAIALTGGTAGALDAINGALLSDGDTAIVATGTRVYVYSLDADSAAVESSPAVISPDSNAGDKRWVLISQASTSIPGMVELATGAETKTGTDTERAVTPDGLNDVVGQAALVPGDIPYSAVATTLTRLAIGAANTKHFINAAGDGHEYATGISIKTESRDLTAAGATVSYTGAGFKPSLVIMFGAISGAIPAVIAAFTEDDVYSLTHYSPAGGPYWFVSATLAHVGTNNVDYQRITEADMTADGVDLTWAKTLSPTGTFSFHLIYFR